ncbi:MAG: toll/interleukin-1 receptor domain-containing protein [Christensenellales bacterium]
MTDEKFTKLICKMCGGPLEFDGSVYVCQACGAKFQDNSVKSKNEIMLISAYENLRKGEFEDAIENFSLIISKDNACHEAFWGRALAKNGIIFVDDLIDGKKIPTCQRISDKSFLNDEDYLKAVELASDNLKKSYVEQADKIEKIRLEWLEKASSEKPYDIFICYKDSDRNNGLERTPDSYEAQNLYTHLTGLGYRVFFSRESLRDKVSEQYEPYIYAALKSARIMIVYGQNPEYFSSTWMKNEWSRYARMVALGDKHSASLIVVYEKCDPSLLPSALRCRQCLDGSKKTFYGDLEKHIEKIVDETTASEGSGVEKIEIAKTVVAKKAKQVKIAAVDLKKIDEGNGYDLTLDEKNQITVVERLIENDFADKADAIVKDILSKNPNNAQALLYGLFIKYHVKSESEFVNLKSFADGDVAEKIINNSTKGFANKNIDLFYCLALKLIDTNENDALNLIDKILPYNYDNRNANVAKLLDKAVDGINPSVFEKVICAVDSKDVDLHVLYLYKFALSALRGKQFSVAKMYFTKTLKIDEGNVDCLRGIIRTTSLSVVSPSECYYGKEVALKGHFDFVEFENLLKYLSDEDRKAEVIAVLNGILEEETVTDNMVEVFNHVIRYYVGDIADLDEQLSAMASRCIKSGYFDSAQYYLRIRLNLNVKTADVYWNLIKAKAKASTDADLVKSSVKISDTPEFVNFLAVANDKQIDRCMELVKKQEAYLNKTSSYQSGVFVGGSEENVDAKEGTVSNGENNSFVTKIKNFAMKDGTVKKFIDKWDQIRENKLNLKAKDKVLNYSTLAFAAIPICFAISYIILMLCEFDVLSRALAHASYVSVIIFAVLSCVQFAFIAPPIYKKIRKERLSIYDELNKNASEKDYYYKKGRNDLFNKYTSRINLSAIFIVIVIVSTITGAVFY